MAYTYFKLADLKNRARRIAREEELPRHEALDEAARRGGFANFIHATRQLSDELPAPAPIFIEVVQQWRDRETRTFGTARTQVSLTISLTDLVKPQHLVANLGGCRFGGDAVLLSDGQMRGAEESEKDVEKIGRTLQFMDATGLKPSRARRCYPKGEWDNRPPIADHDNCWYDPDAGVHILSTEPYPGRASSRASAHSEWEDKHGWSTFLIDWGSIYGHGTELYLLCPDAYQPMMQRKLAALEASPPALAARPVPVSSQARAA